MNRAKKGNPNASGIAWARAARANLEAARADYRASRCEIDPRLDPHSGLDGDPLVITTTLHFHDFGRLWVLGWEERQ